MQLLHARDDDSDLLLKKDEEYAQYIGRQPLRRVPAGEPARRATAFPRSADAYIEQTSAR